MESRKMFVENKKYFVLSIVFSILLFLSFIYFSGQELLFFNFAEFKAIDILILPWLLAFNIVMVFVLIGIFCVGGSFFFCEILCHYNFITRLNFFTGMFSLITLAFKYQVAKGNYYVSGFFIQIIALFLLSISLTKAFYVYTYYSKRLLLKFSAISLFIISIVNLWTISTEGGGGIEGSALAFFAFVSLIIVAISLVMNNSMMNKLKTVKAERFKKNRIDRNSKT